MKLSKAMGFSEPEVEERLRHTPKRQLTEELLLESTDRTTCHVRRRLGHVLLNNGHWREALKIYPQGASFVTVGCNQSQVFTCETEQDQLQLYADLSFNTVC